MSGRVAQGATQMLVFNPTNEPAISRLRLLSPRQCDIHFVSFLGFAYNAPFCWPPHYKRGSGPLP
jgi:hypothetical protein